MGFKKGGKQQKRKKPRKRGGRKSKSARLLDSEGNPAPRGRGRLPAALKRTEKPGVDTTSIPVKRAAMALGHNLTGKGYEVPELKECSDEETLDVLDILDKIEGKPAPRRRGRLPAAFKRPQQPGLDTTSFPGEGNPNSSSGHGEAEAEAEDSEGEEFWECWVFPRYGRGKRGAAAKDSGQEHGQERVVEE